MKLFKRLPTTSSLVRVSGCILFMAAGVWAARRPLDGIVAVVNDDVILASELGEEVSVRLYQLGPSAAKARDVRAYTAEVLTSMVDALLLIQDADEHDRSSRVSAAPSPRRRNTRPPSRNTA
jgi:hypothetical protein